MLLRPCKQCGKTMKVPPTKEQSKFFCNTACRYAATHFIATCQQCGTQYEELTVRRGRSRYCSRECQIRGISASNLLPPQSVMCSVCGRSFETVGSKKLAHKTCSPECANKARGQTTAPSKKIQVPCDECGAMMERFPSRINPRNYCSRQCRGAANTRLNTGVQRTSTITTCLYCGKPVKKFRSRLRDTDRAFCNNACYHAWDALYKSTPDMLARLCERLRDNFGKPSKLEDRVAQWLNDNGLPYERQTTLNVYSMDFKVGHAYIEVQGCYWHGCPACNLLYTPRQQQQQAKDRSKATYCRKRNIPLLTIWEHDIEHNNFSALAPLLQLAVSDA
jgi:G:T-mismatch repair DNA endonuclease (very short patch repair protein)